MGLGLKLKEQNQLNIDAFRISALENIRDHPQAEERKSSEEFKLSAESDEENKQDSNMPSLPSNNTKSIIQRKKRRASDKNIVSPQSMQLKLSLN